MKIAVFSSKPSTETFLNRANKAHGHELCFLEARLTPETVSLADGFGAVCIFVNDMANKAILRRLKELGVSIIALRCAGYNNVDLKAAHELGLCVCRVPAYSPYAVAEHTVGLMLALNRKIHRAHARVRESNFSLEGLLGFDMHGRTVGIVGTGKIGAITAGILKGFGMELLAYDPNENPDIVAMGGKYVPLPKLFERSDIVSLHCPLLPSTYHLINGAAVAQMKDGVMLVNTSRGALIDTVCAIEGLKSGKIGYLGLDVYEEEADLFFEDLSNEVIQDDIFARLLTFPNVIVTGHQAYYTETALNNISDTTLGNVTAYEKDKTCANSVFLDKVKG
ncbi:MAG: 2-hydroxyacid dehydrogenase [Planctomycetes bacterium]|nr:2-hydroxyacid dehydrogenase [Planctomycetota bacterium]